MSGPAPSVGTRVRRAAESSGLDYEVIACDPDLADTAAFCDRYGYPLERSANTIVVASRRPSGVHAACVVLATTRLDVNHRVRDLLGVRKLSFAPAELTVELTGMEVGGVTPLGLPETLPCLVDAAVMEPSWVILGGGDRRSKLRIDPAVLIATGARVVDGLARRVEHPPRDGGFTTDDPGL